MLQMFSLTRRLLPRFSCGRRTVDFSSVRISVAYHVLRRIARGCTEIARYNITHAHSNLNSYFGGKFEFDDVCRARKEESLFDRPAMANRISTFGHGTALSQNSKELEHSY